MLVAKIAVGSLEWWCLKNTSLVGSKRCGGRSNLLLLGLLGQKHLVNVGEHTTGGDGNGAQELGELLIVAHGQLDVAGYDAGLLVVAGSVASELQHLSAEVLEDSGHINGGTGTDTGGVLTHLQVAMHATHGELESRLR